jgi:ABC-type spermidine/putrescine transport system permease subunit II
MTRVLGWATVLLLLLPLVWAVWVSFAAGEVARPPWESWSLRWHARLWTDARWRAALGNSVLVASGATLLALLTAVPAALSQTQRLNRLILLPLAVPPILLGLGLLPTMHLLGLQGTLPGLILAHGLLGMPLVYLATKAAREAMPPGVEAAARGLGASRAAVWLRITLPLTARGIMGGATLAFIVSFNDFFLALFLAGPDAETLPVLIWPALRYSVSPLVASASVWALALAVVGWQVGRVAAERAVQPESDPGEGRVKL